MFRIGTMRAGLLGRSFEGSLDARTTPAPGPLWRGRPTYRPRNLGDRAILREVYLDRLVSEVYIKHER